MASRSAVVRPSLCLESGKLYFLVASDAFAHSITLCVSYNADITGILSSEKVEISSNLFDSFGLIRGTNLLERTASACLSTLFVTTSGYRKSFSIVVSVMPSRSAIVRPSSCLESGELYFRFASDSFSTLIATVSLGDADVISIFSGT
jgi:hypothetical protein